MKVLFLTRSYYPNIGGVEKHIHKLSEVLIKKGINVVILTEKTYSNNYQSYSSSDNTLGNQRCKIIRIDTGSNDWLKKFRIWKELFLHLNLIRTADIVHAHDVYFWYIPFRFIFPFKKNFVTFHGYEGNNLPSLRAVLMHKISELLANGNICVGKFLEKWYHTKANYITYGAIDKNLLKSRKTLQPEKNKCIFIGRLENETGILEYLKAVRFLKLRKINIDLDIYGSGSLESVAKDYAKKNMLNVNFKGFIKNIELVLPNYKFALVSRYLGILECMAVRLPVIAHYNNSIKKDYLELTPFAKFINISNDPKTIADRIIINLGNNNNTILKAYNWVKQETWEKMTDTYLNLWDFKNHE